MRQLWNQCDCFLAPGARCAGPDPIVHQYNGTGREPLFDVRQHLCCRVVAPVVRVGGPQRDRETEIIRNIRSPRSKDSPGWPPQARFHIQFSKRL